MKPSDINLESFSKNFEYEKLSREIDSIENLEQLKDLTKSFVKLYFKQQEVVADMVKEF